MTIIYLQPAYVLHYRVYRETSLLVDLFSRDHGRVSAIAKGARGRRSSSKGLLQPFIALLVSWSGRGELMTLREVELKGVFKSLAGIALLNGFYLNELLVRLLHRFDPHRQLFDYYQQSLLALAQHDEQKQQERVLRLFEKRLLDELGYGLPLRHDADTGLPIDPKRSYYYSPERGFVTTLASTFTAPSKLLFSGHTLVALQQEQLNDELVLADSKRLMRQVFATLLGHKPLKSREMFVKT